MDKGYVGSVICLLGTAFIAIVCRPRAATDQIRNYLRLPRCHLQCAVFLGVAVDITHVEIEF